jgi:hypothetical protein
MARGSAIRPHRRYTEDAFFAATNVRLEEFIKLGLYLWERTKKGDVVFTMTSIDRSIDPDALSMMHKSVRFVK